MPGMDDIELETHLLNDEIELDALADELAELALN